MYAPGSRVPSPTRSDQVWEQTLDGQAHRVEASGWVRHRGRWLVDDVEIATGSTWQGELLLDGGGDGHLRVTFSPLGRARRATLHPAGSDGAVSALLDVGGVDLEPESGSPAAARDRRLREQPVRHLLISTAVGAGKVLVPLVTIFLLALLAQVVLPLLPRIDLPDLPFLDLPDIPFPDLPDLDAPGWIDRVIDVARYVLPVLLALVLARREVRRRRDQDALREQAQPSPAQPDAQPDAQPGDRPGGSS